MKLKLISLLGLAAAATMFITCLPSTAEAGITEPVKTYDGWTGAQGGMLCDDRNCDSDQTGCSWTVHQFDWYWTQYRCRVANPDTETGEDCRQTMKKCRETKTYTGTEYGACTGTITQWSINYYGACG